MPRLTSLVAWGYLILAYGFIFLPVVVLVLFSFQGSRLPVPPFDGPTLKWYANVLADDRLMSALWHSVVVATISSATAVLLAFLAAHALSRTRLPGHGALRGLLIAPIAVSTLIIGLGLLSLFSRIGVDRSLWTVGIGHVVLNLPLCFAIIAAAMGDHQKTAERAARDLGASEARVLWHVSAPMLAPALTAAFFLSMTFSWDEFIIAFLLSRFDVTLPVEIWSLLRSGLSPRTNAIGSLVFLVSIAVLIAVELLAFRRVRR